MTLDRRWILFQIGVPLAAPALLSALFVGAWLTVDARFTPKLGVILDVTPWAIIVYSLTLVGSTFDRSWAKLEKDTLSQLWAAVAANAIYYALLVIRRHDPLFVPHVDAYIVAVVLMAGSVVVCYRAR